MYSRPHAIFMNRTNHHDRLAYKEDLLVSIVHNHIGLSICKEIEIKRKGLPPAESIKARLGSHSLNYDVGANNMCICKNTSQQYVYGLYILLIRVFIGSVHTAYFCLCVGECMCIRIFLCSIFICICVACSTKRGQFLVETSQAHAPSIA